MRTLVSVFFLVFILNKASFSQQSNQFNITKLIETTTLNDQQSSGTCWSFATTSFIEAEAIRLGNDSVKLSPIFYVAPTYMSKAEKYIQLQGKSYFDAGDLTFSVLNAYETHGAIPEEIYNGIIKDDWQHDHVEMDNLLAAMVESVGASGYGRIKPISWKKSIAAVLESYIGKVPETFNYKGKEYTPKSFADKFVGIHPNDYVEITSYTRHPFFKMVVLDIPANWSNESYLNVPINDLEKIIDHAINNGFTLAWDGDASEPNFNFEQGILRLTPVNENIKITQELRQITFDDKSTEDEHNMHIIGKAKDKQGSVYYLLKNSEGNNEMNGYIYMSKNALLLKTISVMVHVDAIPKSIKNKTSLPN